MRLHHYLELLLPLLAVACDGAKPNDDLPRSCVRNQQRVLDLVSGIVERPACAEDADCPCGTSCEAGACTASCIADGNELYQCATGDTCEVSGRCIPAARLSDEHAVIAATAPTLIDFETLATGTWVTNQYASLGVVFPNGAYVDSDANAHSPSHVLRSSAPTTEFDTSPLVITFTSPQTSVKLYAGSASGSLPITGTLVAYDASGSVVVQDGPHSVPTGPYTALFQVAATTATIQKVTLDYSGAYGAPKLIDDLAITGSAPPPPPTPPVVAITSPAYNQQFTVPALTVVGKVVGTQILSSDLVVTSKRPPGSTTPPTTTYPLTLSGSGTTYTFSKSIVLGVGYQWLTARATNTGGTGLVTTLVVNLPQLIRDRFATDGGAAVFGSFQWGGPPSGGSTTCTYAVYTNGAVVAANGAAYTVRGQIFAKWLSLKDATAFPRLGCPTSDVRAAAVGGGTAQDFEHGRIYADSTGAYYVSTVFENAIDQLGGELGVGVPIADPTSNSAAPSYTWQFQQFRKEGATIASTLEIRGSAPRLWVERQGGDSGLYTGLTRDGTTPTIVESYACTSTAGPCPVVRDPNAGQRRGNAGDYCLGADGTPTDFDFGQLSDYVLLGDDPKPKEWNAIYGDYVQTALAGVVAHTEMSSEDNPWAHENPEDPCPWPPWPWQIPGLLADLASAASGGDTLICPADWNIHIRPLPHYENLMVYGEDNINVEVENTFLLWHPYPGSLVFTSGRFIADCGHENPWKTEIHPPSLVAIMGGETYNSRPSTSATVWVGGFYSGTTIELDLYPPPRPSPSSTLGYVKPVFGPNDITVTETVLDGNRVHLSISAPTRVPSINPLGEMMWQTSRLLQGQYHLYWN